MSKVILVIDMPRACTDCQFYYDYLRCMVTEKSYCSCDDKPDWCPLKPMPQKKIILDIRDNDEDIYEVFQNKINVGYNRCINEILGGNEDEDEE